MIIIQSAVSATIARDAEVQAAIKNDVPNIKLATTAYRAACRRVMLYP